MAQTLDIILENLHSDKNRLRFLNKIYTPGNAEVADAILALDPNNIQILEGEVEYSRTEGENDRFGIFARKFIDNYIAGDWDILLRNRVKSWGDKELADYAISKLREKDRECSLEYAAELAIEFGKEDEGKQILEKVFDIQMARSGEEYPSSPASTAVKLGRFDEAINLYIKAGYHWLDTALEVAKEHVPKRTIEIAILGFNDYNPHIINPSPGIYLESAIILDKKEKAEKVLKKEAKKLKVNSDPRYYKELVNALINLELNNEARSVANKVEAYEIKQMQTQDYYDGSNQRELARIFLALGDKEKAAEAYLRKINKELSKNHPSQFMSDIDKVYELTGDNSVLQKKIFVFEREGQYSEAASLAAELGKTDLAETYNTMQTMISEVPTQTKD